MAAPETWPLVFIKTEHKLCKGPIIFQGIILTPPKWTANLSWYNKGTDLSLQKSLSEPSSKLNRKSAILWTFLLIQRLHTLIQSSQRFDPIDLNFCQDNINNLRIKTDQKPAFSQKHLTMAEWHGLTTLTWQFSVVVTARPPDNRNWHIPGRAWRVQGLQWCTARNLQYCFYFHLYSWNLLNMYISLRSTKKSLATTT